MKNAPAITIGILTHNYGHYIREAIDSVLAQTRTDWELVICDDASTDDTTQIVAPYLADPRIRYVRHDKNLGQGGNWGFALEQGSAPILAVLHADDQYLPHTLGTVLPLFSANPELDIVYGNWWVQADGQSRRTLGTEITAQTRCGCDEYPFQLRRNTLLPSATFVTRRLVKIVGHPVTTLKIAVDFEFFLRACTRAEKVQAVPEPLVIYRTHPGSAIASDGINHALVREQERLPDYLIEHKKLCPNLPHGLRELRAGAAMQTFSAGVTEILYGNLLSGKTLMKRALKTEPRLLRHALVLTDLALSHGGVPGFSLLRRLHRKRLRSDIETA